MRKVRSVEQVAEQMLESVLASPNRQRRLMSKTFWHQFGFKVRSRARVDEVWDALRQRGVVISVSEGEFGSEEKKDWIVLTFVPPDQPREDRIIDGDCVPIPAPDPAWFERIMNRRLSSEREVEYFFAMPLLEQLGYPQERIALGYRVTWQEGITKRSKEADIVVFADGDKQNAVIVVEAKSAGKALTGEVAGQAKSYSLQLRAPYYVLTNGEQVRVFHFRSPWRPDVLQLALSRGELKDKWSELYRYLNPETVAAFEERLRELFQATPEPE